MSIIHKNQVYDLSHLEPKSFEFSWQDKDGSTSKFQVWVRYSNHCYSEERTQILEDDTIVERKALTRVFCVKRYGETHRLTNIIEEMMSQPTKTIQVTTKGNYYVFRLIVERKPQSRYCVFFRLVMNSRQPLDGSAHHLDMYIESAYIKKREVKVVAKMPFGKLAWNTAKK